MRKFPVILVSLIFCCHVTPAQVTDDYGKGWKLSVAGVAGRFSTIDKSYSSIPFSGMGWGASSWVSYEPGKVLHEAGATYSQANLKADNYTSSTASQNLFDVYYTALFRVGTKDQSAVEYRVGGIIDFLSVRRKYDDFLNRNLSSETATSLGGAFDISWLFEDAGISISDRLSLPFIGYLSQPEPGNTGKDFRAKRMVSINSFFRIKNKIILEKRLTEHHNLALSYHWDYYKIESFHEVRQANHQLALSYCYLF